MDNIPDNIAILIYKLNCLKSVLEYDFFSRDKTNTSGEIINAIQYKIPDQKPKGITYSIKKNKHPIISHVPYPDVLVAHASNQQNSLKAVFYHGTQAGQFPISLAQLTPHKIYQSTGGTVQTIVADALGNATFMLEVNGRTEIFLSLKAAQ